MHPPVRHMANVKAVQHRLLQRRFILDCVMILAGMLFAYALRFYVLHWLNILPVEKGYDPRDYAWLLAYALPVMVMSYSWTGMYGLRDPVFNYDIGKRVIRGTLLGVALVLTINFFFREAEYARPVFMTAPFSVIGFVFAGRLYLRQYVDRLRAERRIGDIGTLIVGAGDSARLLIRKIHEHPECGLEVGGAVAAQTSDAPDEVEGVPVLGTISDMMQIVREKKIRRVIFAQPNLTNKEIFDLMAELEKELVDARFVPNLLESHLTDCSFENLDGLPLFGLKDTPLQGMNLVVKNLFDKIVSSIMLLLGAPFYALIALAVWLDSGRPLFYKQRRLGMDGRSYNMYKFRSMRLNAEQNGPGWTRPDDDRVTRIGRFLRRWNLDEWPQLINVWRGDMSLVGPRPERPEWAQKFKEEFPHYMMRHTVKSGMTGWAQVNGLRGDTDLQARLDADLYYIENWTLWLDIKILLMTMRATKNAY
ncbi:undecaprenyl-phosphate glucose phosphotransferase [Candidatus Sumerlaeota bacterium]|nr:undecaprenyl-phosphate glucose phosphotransferase [Candidatus Sumerlaeota bacterium]